MADQSRAGINAEFTFGRGKSARASRDPDAKFRMLLVGDFGGHSTRGEARSLNEVRPLRVDVDSFPSVMNKLAPRISIALGDQPPFAVAITDLDDFHPSHLYAHLELFGPMREIRRQLQDPKTFDRAAALLGQVSQEPAPAAAPAPPAAAPAAGDDIARLLGRPASAAPAPAPQTAASVVDSLVRQAVAPHIVGKADPRQAHLTATVDGMSGELMRAILHDPGFQRVEAAWRGLDRLVRTLELDENLQLFVLDVSKEELIADFAATPELADSAMYRILVGHTNDTPWSLVVMADHCGRQQEDSALLARLGTLAQAVDAAVVVGMDARAWTPGVELSLEDQRGCVALRSSGMARSIAAGYPSILLRLPYGKGTDPVEGFAFTEQTAVPRLERYLWGSAAFVLAESLASSYAAAGGWGFSPGDVSAIGDLPVHAFAQDGDGDETPVAQVWLPERKIDELIKEGMSPIVSVRGRGEARIARLQSIASPPAALAGRWR